MYHYRDGSRMIRRRPDPADGTEESYLPRRRTATGQLVAQAASGRSHRRVLSTGYRENSDEVALEYEQAAYTGLPEKIAPISDIQEMGRSQLQLMNHYRRRALHQAQQSLLLALVAGIVGIVFLLAAMGIFPLKVSGNISIISAISGIITELLSAYILRLYSQTSRQFHSFHTYLDRTCRFLLAERACEQIRDENKRDETISQLILAFMQTDGETPFEAGASSQSKANAAQ